jgi:ABC-2 type transport system ATP-binding protein/sodium transport system ATP-binding protein
MLPPNLEYANGAEPAIHVRDLVKRFPSAAGDVLAVNGVSLQVSAGEVFGLLGANGAGKTTTLRMMLGLLKPTSGIARIAGFDVAAQPEDVKRNIALVSASAGLYQWLTPRELMHYFADLYDVAPDAAAARVELLADLFDLRKFMDRQCAGMSTGQQQRVNLARSLMHDPPVVLMDEPTRGLDIVGSKRIFDFTSHLKEIGKAVIFCTHRLEEAQRLCNRFGLMFRGRLQLEGNLSDLRQITGRESITDMFLDLMAREQQIDRENQAASSLASSSAASSSGSSSLNGKS